MDDNNTLYIYVNAVRPSVRRRIYRFSAAALQRKSGES